MKIFLSFVVLVAGSILAHPSADRDLVVSRTLIEDVSGTLTIADVAHLEGKSVGPNLAVGSTQSVYWMRLQVQPPAHGSQVVLFIRPSYINEIRLYEAAPGDPMGWKIRVIGNRIPFRQRDRARFSLGFDVNTASQGGTFYLRFKTISPLDIQAQALEPAEADRLDHKRDLVEVFFVTSMLLLLLWALHSYLLDRQPVVGLFALHQAAYTLFGIAATGYLAPITTARFPYVADWLNAILYLAISFTSLLFCRRLFKPYEPPALLMRGLTLLPFTFPILLAAYVLGYNAFAINGNAVVIKITWIYFVVVAFSLRKESTPRRRYLQVFFVSILLNNAVFWLASRNDWIASKVNLSAVQTLVIDGLVIGGLFALILHSRARQTLRGAQRAAMNLILVQKKFEVEQELKKQYKVEAQTDYLTGLCNRRRFIELAERELTRAIRFQRPVALLVIDIDHFKATNDTWGHSTGDLVLKRVSSVIRHGLRDEDILGRIGGEEFAALIVETGGDEALEVAQRVCTTVADACVSSQGGDQVCVSVSIGLAELNGRSIDIDTLLREADEAMYGAKRAGRNRVFVNKGVATEQPRW